MKIPKHHTLIENNRVVLPGLKYFNIPTAVSTAMGGKQGSMYVSNFPCEREKKINGKKSQHIKNLKNGSFKSLPLRPIMDEGRTTVQGKAPDKINGI